MAHSRHRFRTHLSLSLRTVIFGPQLFAFLPALILMGYWFGGESALIALAVGFPVVVGLVWAMTPIPAPAKSGGAVKKVTQMPTRAAMERFLDKSFGEEKLNGLRSVAIVLEIDDFTKLTQDYGDEDVDRIIVTVANRLLAMMREGDTLCSLDRFRFGIALAPTVRADLETTVQISARLQSALADPIEIEGTRLFLTASIGFCLPRRASEKSGVGAIGAAETALAEAQGIGRSTIRAFTARKRRKRVVRAGLVGEVENALENGQVKPWFQPQLCTDTGKVSGAEALARWSHPDHGVVLPGAFLPAISAAGLSNRLGEIILYQSLAAIRDWDEAGLDVPTVGVNFSSDDLSDPQLCDKIKWEFDRFKLTPDRLTVEILETVIAQDSNDIIVQNISKLSDMGCQIDLDDFGTGHASIANIRRFFVKRIKIDRSFVTQVDIDRQQQQMLTAILEMASRLDINTLAEGVETAGKHAILSQLGCSHVQGYHIAKPLPFADMSKWLIEHQKQVLSQPEFTKKSGA